MLLLTFQAGECLYAIEARQVVEVIPLVPLLTVPVASNALAGLLSYRGSVVPVVEFCRLMGGDRAPEALSSRIILARSSTPSTGDTTHIGQVVGLIAARVIQLVECRPEDKIQAVMNLSAAPYFDGVVRTTNGLAQLVEPRGLLADRLPTPVGAADGEPAP